MGRLFVSSCLNMSLYVSNVAANKDQITLEQAVKNWQDSSESLNLSMQQLFRELSKD